ncbi:4-hydroxyphenylpyruvate dioxygenase [Sulfoacidibacillus thermotolerans]|uniref:4-hydroxyphenylpyruvate dioxygenase n=1 Tax=Sulfoacidibacillus thermotolerans TaxID=1765684 RepID=A0A2U3DCG1_SULT2|nr:4-hydroxyphenylpyruvate dioxygenase [Sulfoacidibacillus thermotolerans]PWI58971.1 4-hydroxyphenylpyruvate dioxygenase [Sulfoacidibacillus thermotolerans]
MGVAQSEFHRATAQGVDHLPIKYLDYIEFYVGNAKQAAYFLAHAFGFVPFAYRGLETGSRERVSYALKQGSTVIVVTSALHPDHEIGEFVRLHGDGVKDVAFAVDDVQKAYEAAVLRGARGIVPPYTVQDEYGVVSRAVIGTYGDTVHTLIARESYQGTFMPGFVPYAASYSVQEKGLVQFDHVVGNVELGKMEEWVHYYRQALGFSQFISFDDQDINTEYSALMSKVMANHSGRIKLPINEPATGRKKSQIQEFLDFYAGPGVQHVALLTHDIKATVRALQASGVEFLRTPHSYYEHLRATMGDIEEGIDELEELNILLDRDEEGYLLQIFTRPVVDRPTFFFEIIQRKGSRGFGKGNFKALFEAIEREQALRGNL